MRGGQRALATFAVMSALLAVTVAASGCAASDSATTPAITAAPPVRRLTKVPDLRGKTVHQAADIMKGQSGVTALVTFPGADATMAVSAKRVAGVLKPFHVATFHEPDRTVSLRDASNRDRAGGAAHVIQAQSPAPGSALATGTTINLTAGPHPDNHTFAPWISGHAVQVKREGASPCFGCHTAQECSNCHVDLPER